jgi:hypothetical protein
MWISTNVTNIYLASIRFGTLQYLLIHCIKASISQGYWVSYLTLIHSSEFFFGDKVREGLTLVGAFPREPLTLAEKGTLSPKKSSLIHRFQLHSIRSLM